MPSSLLPSLLTCAVVAVPGLAAAGVVAGKLELPAAPERPAVAQRGYLDRAGNPYLPVAEVDPTPQLVVVLEGGPEGGPPRAEVVWEIRGDAFSQPLLPVQAGGSVLVKNTSRRPVTVSVVEDPALLKNVVINPPASKAFKVPAAGTVLTVVDPERAHVRGKVVVFASRHFAVPAPGGSFEIADVPPGKWKLRIWYQGGWLTRTDEEITVTAGRTELRPRVPPGYPVAGAPAPEKK